MPDNKEQYYTYLKDAGANVPETYESFTNTLSNPESSQQYYDYLKENKYNTPDTYESFQTTLGITTPTEGEGQEIAPVDVDQSALNAEAVLGIDEQLNTLTAQATEAQQAIKSNDETLFKLKEQIDDSSTDIMMKQMLIDQFNQTEQATIETERTSQEMFQKKNELEIERQKLLPPEEREEEVSVGAVEGFINSIQRGIAQGEIADLMALGSEPTREDILKIASLKREQEALPPSDAYKEFMQAKTVLGMAKELVEDPIEITSQLVTESMAALLRHGWNRMAVAGATGAAMGSVVPGIGTIAGGGYGLMSGSVMAGYNLEASNALLESLSEAGIDLTDEQSMIDGFNNPELMDKAKSYAMKRAVPIAIFDMFTAGIAGKFLATGAKTFGKKALRTGAEFGIQMTGAGLGETSAQLISKGEITPTEIFAEMIGELGGGAPDVVVGTFINREKKGDSSLKDMVQADIPQELVDQMTDISEGLGEITPEQSAKIKEDYAQAQEAKEVIPEAHQDNEKVIDLVVKKQQLQKEIGAYELEVSAMDDVFKPEYQKIIKDKQTEVTQLDKDIVNELKPTKDAVQEPSTEEIPFRDETSVSEEVGKEVPSKEPTKEGEEVVKPTEDKKPTPVKVPQKERRSEEIAKERGVEFTTQEEAERFIAEESESPLEIAETFASTETPESTKSYKHEAIEGANIQITNKEFNQYFDKKAKTVTLARRFIKEGRKIPLDTKLQELSETAGIEITPQDFVKYMEVQQGKASIIKSEPIKKKLRDRFFELTGKKLTPKFAEATINNEAKKAVDKIKYDYDKNIEKEYTDFNEAEQGYYEDFKRQAAALESAKVVSDVKRDEKVGEGAKPKEEAEPETIGISRAKRKELREELGMKPEAKLTDLEKHTDQFLHDEANRLVESGEANPSTIAEELLSGKGKFTDLTGAILARGLLDLNIKRKDQQKEIFDARSNADAAKEDIAYDGFMDSLASMEVIHNAIKKKGTETGRALQSFKKLINTDYTIGAVYARFKKRKKGQPLDKAFLEHLTEKVLEIEQLKEKQTVLEQQIEDIPKDQRKKPTKRAKSKKRLNELKDERKQLFSDWKKYRDGGANPVVKNAMVPIGDKDYVFLARLALNYAESGVINVQELSAKLRADVKKHLNMRLTDIEIDAILQTEVEGEKVLAAFDFEQLEDSLKETKIETEKKKRNLDKEEKAFEWVDLLDKDNMKENFIRVVGLPRSLRSSFDLSAPFRQGLVGTIAHPKSGAKAMYQMFAQVFSEKNYENWIVEYKQSSDWALAEKSGLFITDETDIHQREEEFISDLGEKLPLGIGKGVRASARAYSGYLNVLRADIFKNGVKSFEKRGYTFDSDPEVFEQWADFTNNMTCRGKMPTKVLENAAPLLTAVIWSPSLIVSRINLLSHRHLWGRSVPRVVKIKAAYDMMKMWGFTIGVLTLANSSGAEVEDDPRSSDFGKIKVGNRRYDVTGGLAAYITLSARFATKQRKSTSTGEMRTISRYLYPYHDRIDLLATFARYKVSPLVGAGINMVAEADAMGMPTNALKEISQLAMPLSLMESYSALERGGPLELLKTGVPSMLGVGVGVYGAQDEEADIREDLIQERKWEAEDYEGNWISHGLDAMVGD